MHCLSARFLDWQEGRAAPPPLCELAKNGKGDKANPNSFQCSLMVQQSIGLALGKTSLAGVLWKRGSGDRSQAAYLRRL